MVALHADTGLGSFPVVAHVSERIIVRVGGVKCVLVFLHARQVQ